MKYLVIILLVSFIFILKENVDNVLEVMKIGYVKSYLREQEKNLLYYFITIFEFLFVIYFGLNLKK